MATVDLRAKSRNAWEAKEADRIAAARDALGAVIGAANAAVDAVDVVDVEEFPDGYAVIFVDAGGVHVATSVRDSGSVTHLVESDGTGGWTRLGERATSLAHLWELIAQHLPPESETYPAWDTQVAYAVGDRVTYGGDVYECTQAHQSQAGWEPPNVPALWSKVAA